MHLLHQLTAPRRAGVGGSVKMRRGRSAQRFRHARAAVRVNAVAGRAAQRSPRLDEFTLNDARSTAVPRRYTDAIRRVFVMSSSGFASTTMKSALLPTAMVPASFIFR